MAGRGGVCLGVHPRAAFYRAGTSGKELERGLGLAAGLSPLSLPPVPSEAGR